MTLTVVKLGGSLLEDRVLRNSALNAIAQLWRTDEPLVVVHGGGKHVDAALMNLGIPKRTHAGLRITDADTLQVVVGVLAGNVNKSLVTELTSSGMPAVGISGADKRTLSAIFHPPIDGIDLGFVGQISSCDPAMLDSLLYAGLLPVVASLAAGPGEQLLNVNADSAAASVACGLEATRLVFLTDVEGLRDGHGGLVRMIGKRDAESLLDEPFVTGGMRPKLRACIDSLSNGVGEVIIAGPANHASALLDGEGGTRLVAA